LLWQAGEAAQALTYFSSCANGNKNVGLRFRASLGQALCYWANGDTMKLSAQLDRAFRLAGSLKLAAATRGRLDALAGLAAFAARDFEAAAAHFRSALRRNPSQLGRAQLMLNLGMSLQAQGRRRVALQQYNQAAALLRAWPRQLARIEILRASIHLQDRKLDATYRLKPAEAALMRAAELLEANPPDTQARAILEAFMGRTYSRRGNIQRGLSYLNSALQLSQSATDEHLFADVFRTLAILE
jgi:tetratricopeptide (TPR) repeat protein